MNNYLSCIDFKINQNTIAKSIIINRPDKRNALTLDMLSKIILFCEENQEYPLIFRGQGTVFSAGLDLKIIASLTNDYYNLGLYFETLIQCFIKIFSHPHRTIALLNGSAVGGGLGIALCCDFIIADQNAKLILPGGELAKKAHLVTPPLHLKLSKSSTQINAEYGLNLSAPEALNQNIVDKTIDLISIQKQKLDSILYQFCSDTLKLDTRLNIRNQIEFNKLCLKALKTVKSLHNIDIFEGEV